VKEERTMAEQRSGRPVSASQRPTGGDKAIITGKKQYFRRKKVCRFCVERIDDINYKDVRLLQSFISERGKITPRRITGVCAPHQRRLSEAIKQARNIALLPFASQV
jgi:small subunit ribosomal protein S18